VTEPPSGSLGMIDLHCHYLPGVDDGAPDLEAGLALARAASDNGVVMAVLTPHVFPGRWNNALHSLTPEFERFRSAVDQAGIPLELRLGAEVHLLPESLQLLDAGQLPSIGEWDGRRVILLELPDGGIPVGAMKAVEFLLRRGVVPMLAHPERNKDVMRSREKLRPFVEVGCLVQLTAASVCGWFGAPAYRTAHSVLEAGWVTAIATDAHNLRHRPPVLAEARHAIRMRYGPDIASQLTQTNPLAIVAASHVPPPEGTHLPTRVPPRI
jgi:protein-tyrosine phosphatase